MTTIVQANKIPETNISVVYKYNKETIDAINEVKEMLKNPEKYESYKSVKELMEDLNN